MKQIISKEYLKDAFWHDPTGEDKSILTCICISKFSDNTTERKIYDLNKINSDGSNNKDYEEAVNEIGEDVITEFTLNRAKRKEYEQKQSSIIQEQKAISKNLEKMFNLKLQAFNIDEIQNCDDLRLRSKVRKAKNEVELYAWATIIMMKSLENENT